MLRKLRNVVGLLLFLRPGRGHRRLKAPNPKFLIIHAFHIAVLALPNRHE